MAKRIVDVSGYNTKRLGVKQLDNDWVRQKWLRTQDPFCSFCAVPCWFKGDPEGPKQQQATVDHLIPLSKGGVDLESNWTLACYKCNQEKRDQVIITDKLEHNEADLTGRVVGFLTVVGKHLKNASDGARWIVVCNCRRYEVRSARSIKTPTDPIDCCIICKKKYRGEKPPRSK